MADYQDPLPGWLAALPDGSELSRRTWLEIKYTPAGGSETDISEDVSRFFLSLTYTDNLSDEADDITLELEDRAQLWQSDWFPEGEGNFIDITIHTYNRVTLHDGESVLHAGRFEIDEIEVTGYPSTVRIKAVAVLGDSILRGTRHNQTWEEITVQKCAVDIASRNGLSLRWECEENPELDHVEQADESDLEFLLRICHDHGISLKITTDEVILFDDAKYEATDPVLTVYKPGLADTSVGGDTVPVRWLRDYHMQAKTRDTYWKCQVKYQKGKEKELIEGEFAAPNKTKGRILYVREQVKDVSEAERLAKKKLREANKDEMTGEFVTLGRTDLAAGQVAELSGFGHFDGNYLIMRAVHEVRREYTTKASVRRCLDGY